MKKLSERKTPRARADAPRQAPNPDDRVRVVRVNDPDGRAVRWHVSRTDTKN